jgi:hypothetical protein
MEMRVEKAVQYRPVADLPVRTCQWHGGQKGPDGWLVFCGKRVREDSSYCAEHHKRVYQRITTFSERAAAAANDAERQAA